MYSCFIAVQNLIMTPVMVCIELVIAVTHHRNSTCKVVLPEDVLRNGYQTFVSGPEYC